MNTQSPSEDDVPVTGDMLAFIQLIQACKRKDLALMSLDSQASWVNTTRDAFFGEYAKYAKVCGLKLNEITFEAVERYAIPEVCMHTDFQDLPKRFVFNPWRGGIRSIANAPDGTLERHAALA